MPDQTVHIQNAIPHPQFPDIPFRGTVEFINDDTGVRLLEFFDTANLKRPVVFVQLQPGQHVIVVGGHDTDCHKPAVCPYNVRIPGDAPPYTDTGGNKIIINS